MDERGLSEYLSRRNVPHEILTVRSAGTAAEAAEGLGVELGQVVKSLLCRSDADLLLALVPGDRELSLAKLRHLRGAQVTKLASRREVEQVTGYAVGAVAPIGLRSSVPILGDLYLRDRGDLYCGGGSTQHMLRIAVFDLEQLTGLRWLDLSSRAGDRAGRQTRSSGDGARKAGTAGEEI